VQILVVKRARKSISIRDSREEWISSPPTRL
jgi:hypothetical protein